jgi:hypothetical protein
LLIAQGAFRGYRTRKRIRNDVRSEFNAVVRELEGNESVVAWGPHCLAMPEISPFGASCTVETPARAMRKEVASKATASSTASSVEISFSSSGPTRSYHNPMALRVFAGELFDKHDKDRNGLLSRTELRGLMEEFLESQNCSQALSDVICNMF